MLHSVERGRRRGRAHLPHRGEAGWQIHRHPALSGALAGRGGRVLHRVGVPGRGPGPLHDRGGREPAGPRGRAGPRDAPAAGAPGGLRGAGGRPAGRERRAREDHPHG